MRFKKRWAINDLKRKADLNQSVQAKCRDRAAEYRRLGDEAMKAEDHALAIEYYRKWRAARGAAADTSRKQLDLLIAIERKRGKRA
ncbi:hypothetical protein CH289_10850 [Rhodococcus sp. RS1C4]|nr:hypothetical protein [Rhodococcus sp. RS1C4]OZC52784.1 hypothetical protein CH289_10850 [Rhodococcus sp. RS1C4]